MCSLCHKAVGDVNDFLSECEALDGERALRATLRDVANENFAINVLNSIKDYEIMSEWLLCGNCVMICWFSRHLTVDFDVPVTFFCPSLGVCLHWGEPKRAPLLRVGRLPAYASDVDIYIYIGG